MKRQQWYSLQHKADEICSNTGGCDFLKDAQTRLAALTAENERLREALESANGQLKSVAYAANRMPRKYASMVHAAMPNGYDAALATREPAAEAGKE